MPDKPTPKTSRRGLFRSVGRYLTAIGLVAGATILTRAGTSRSGQTCINRSICGGCKAFDNCQLPAALSAKQAQGARKP